jgi:hypothetical protein
LPIVENEIVGTTVSLPSIWQHMSLTAGTELTWLMQHSGSVALTPSEQQSASAGGRTVNNENIKASKNLTIFLSITQLVSAESYFYR